MKYSKKSVFRHGRLEHVSRDSNPDSPFVRIAVDGEFFFTNLMRFENPDDIRNRVSDLPSGQEVFLGAHRLADGSFWLHWLKAPGRLDLIPPSPEKAVPSAWGKALLWVIGTPLCFLLGVAFIASGVLDGGLWHTLLGTPFIIGGVLCAAKGWEGAAVLLNSATSLDKSMRRGLEALNTALADGHAWDVPGLEPGTAITPPSLPEALPEGVRLCRAERVEVHKKSVNTNVVGSKSSSATKVDFLVYTFPCNGETVNWAVKDETLGSHHMLAFRRRHPPFLAEGDQGIVYYANPPGGLAGFMHKYSQPSVEGTSVVEFFNCTDRTAYCSETDLRESLPLLYAGVWLVLAIMAVLLLFVGLVINRESWFLPALASALEFAGLALCSGVVALGVLLLVLELWLALGGKNTDIAAGRKRWREAVAPLRRKTDAALSRSPRRQWLFALRLVIIPVCMGLAGFCLTFFWLG